jgi:hypothetical protein
MTHIIFSRRHHPGSVLLRAGLWSPWSHCGVIDHAKGEVVQAVAGSGVIATPLDAFKNDASRFAVVSFPFADAGRSVAAARNQIGKRYDLRGVTGTALHRRWDDPDAWFCSELVAYALREGGLHLFRTDAWRITPQHLWMLDLPVIEEK